MVVVLLYSTFISARHTKVSYWLFATDKNLGSIFQLAYHAVYHSCCGKWKMLTNSS